MVNLFVYGTLINDEVVKAVTGKTFSKAPASLSGYFVAKLENLKCPGLVVKPNASANGYILKDVDEKSASLIDKWEDSRYSLGQVVTDDGTKCDTYLWTKDFMLEEWDNNQFRNLHMSGYINDLV